MLIYKNLACRPDPCVSVNDTVVEQNIFHNNYHEMMVADPMITAMTVTLDYNLKQDIYIINSR